MEREESYIGIKLTDKGGEIIVLEVSGEEITSKLWRAPYNEGGQIVSP